jgi:hypothetical protein
MTSLVDSQGTKVSVDPNGYTDTGFSVTYENAPESVVLSVNYMAM